MLSASLEQVVLRSFEDLGDSFSLMCAILWRTGQHETLVGLKVPPERYADPLAYFKACQAVALVKKLRGLLDNDAARSDLAFEKWREGEHACFRTNQRLYPYLPRANVECDERLRPHFEGVRDIVRELIGSRPPELLNGRLGPGATFSDRGYKTTVPHKFSTDPTLTTECVWLLPQFFGTAWGAVTARGERSLSFVRGNRFTTVPKTSLVDRSIAVEPSINVFYQLAAGGVLRRRLQRNAGWDLDHAQSIHRRIAQESSVTREFATLDLSNASDTVAYNLVKLLLPHDWFELLDMLRSPYSLVASQKDATDSHWWKLEKFSSMGNGFTFELETIIFAALCIYCTRRRGWSGVLGTDVFVFGDDIIVRDDVVTDVVALLNFCGFQLNDDKSFSGMSPFRESCGADFYIGADVRPSYLKEEPQDVKGAIGICNRLHKVGQKIANLGGTFGFRAWRAAYNHVPQRYRHFGPKDLGDVVVWHDDWQRVGRVKWANSIRYVQGIKPGATRVVPYKDFDPSVVLASAVYGAGNVGTPVGGRVPIVEGVTPRDAIRSYVVGWYAFS